MDIPQEITTRKILPEEILVHIYGFFGRINSVCAFCKVDGNLFDCRSHLVCKKHLRRVPKSPSARMLYYEQPFWQTPTLLSMLPQELRNNIKIYIKPTKFCRVCTRPASCFSEMVFAGSVSCLVLGAECTDFRRGF